MKLRHLGYFLKYMGPVWLGYRALYWAKIHGGYFRLKTPSSNWPKEGLSEHLNDPRLGPLENYYQYRAKNAPRFFFAASDRNRFKSLFSQWDEVGPSPVTLADQISQGVIRYFAGTNVRTGFPPDWHKNAFTGERLPADRHWSEIGDFGAGDIKAIWEPSRFGFVYVLVRAYWRTGDEKYAECFWKLVEDWRHHNPPNLGPNWKCGQETSFRVMAWCFGLYGFMGTDASTAARVALLGQMVAVSGERIGANIDFAISQRNNHGISEGMGLWTIGTLFPEFRHAARWKALGRRVLEKEGRDLIYDDGSFAQHSMMYHRVLLHDYLWVIRLAELNGAPFSAELKKKVSLAASFAVRAQDESSGQLPLYGSSDGSLILPFSNTDYLDFRPVLQTASHAFHGIRWFERGPWDEDLLWLYGADALDARLEPPQRTDLRDGYSTMRTPESFVFVRCGEYQHRPGQADTLHVDLWWRGINLAIDPGTFSYNAPPPWDDPFARTAYHNTITVDGQDQMDRVTHFIWLPWLRGKVECLERSTIGHIGYWQGEHDGYERLKSPVSHRRAIVRLGDEHWLVLDNLKSNGNHTYRLHWLFADLPHQWDEAGELVLKTPFGPYIAKFQSLSVGTRYSLLRGDEGGPRGWRASRYYYHEPALSIEVTVNSTETTFCTVVGPGDFSVATETGKLKVTGSSLDALIHLSNEPGRLVRSIRLDGSCKDELNIS